MTLEFVCVERRQIHDSYTITVAQINLEIQKLYV